MCPSGQTNSVTEPGGGSRPSVSVILPVYNGSATVRAAVESIRAQTFTDWELVVLDDGSTDDSLEICRGIADDDVRIRVLS